MTALQLNAEIYRAMGEIASPHSACREPTLLCTEDLR